MKTTVCEQFDLDGHIATIIRPKNPNGEWIWKTEFLYAFDQAERAACDDGYTRVYYSVSDMYGCQEAVDLMKKFYGVVVKQYDLHPKCHLAGFSRGGLYAFNFALACPEKVASVYLDAPVLDLRTWPGTDPAVWQEAAGMMSVCGVTKETIDTYAGNPVNRLDDFVATGLPLLLIAGDADEVVPFDKNGKRLADAMSKAGRPFEMTVKPGCGHHPHSLTDPEPILSFWRAHPSGARSHVVTFRVGDAVTKQTVPFGQMPTLPAAPEDLFIAGYDKTVTPATCDKEYTAILTDGKRVPPHRLYDAYRHQLACHRRDAQGKIKMHSPTEYWNALTASFVLALEEYESPKAGPVRDRLVEQIKRLTVGGQAPIFDCEPIWHAPALTGTVALARITPTVWNALSDDDHERLDCIMRSYVYNSSFGTADWNDFHTGPGLYGNYRRDWNVNYAIPNVMPLVSAIIYFGSADEVNRLIENFDFDTAIADFEKYGFDDALAVWSADRDKTRALMMDGVECDLLADSPSGNKSGPGRGVRWQEPYHGFVYHGFSLYQPDKIFDYNANYCFSGGPVTPDGSEHRGWTLKDGDKNPMLGRDGMIVELNQPSRSSITYSLKDFDMFAVELALLDAVGIWSPAEHPEIMEKAKAGMNDLIYKYKMGYHSWASATNKNGSDDYENAFGGYYFARALWMTLYDDTMLYLFPDGKM